MERVLLAVYKFHIAAVDVKPLSVSTVMALSLDQCIAIEREPMQCLINQHAMEGCTKSALVFRLILQC